MLHTIVLLAMMEGASPAPPPLTAPEIVARMVRADNERIAALAGYKGSRRYRFENKRFNKRAELTANVVCDNNGAKTFEVTAENGSGFVRNRIIRKMIQAEEDASHKGEHERTRIVPANYDFKLVGTDILEGRGSYVLQITPKTPSKYSMRGRIWVDGEDFAIARIEGEPAKNPSFWIHSVKVVQRYQRAGQFWLPVANQSKAEARVFGDTEMVIEYFDYTTSTRTAQAHDSGAE